MQSLFELKTEVPFDAKIREHMIKTASELLKNADKGQYTQALVLTTDKGEYGAVISNALSPEKAEEGCLLDRLRTADDTAVRYVLCMWGDAGIDLPSHAFRELLCELDPQNAEALIFVRTKSGISAVKLQTTLK